MEIMLYNQNSIPVFANKELNKATKKIASIAGRVYRNMYEIAATLAEVSDKELYKDDGFKSAVDYAEKVFKLKKSSAYTMITIGKKYTNTVIMESNLPHDPGKDFSVTQIEKMLPLKDDVTTHVESKEIKPEMSCSEISKVVKSILKDAEPEEEKKADEPEEQVESESEQETEVEVEEIFNLTTEVMYLESVVTAIFDRAEQNGVAITDTVKAITEMLNGVIKKYA